MKKKITKTIDWEVEKLIMRGYQMYFYDVLATKFKLGGVVKRNTVNFSTCPYTVLMPEVVSYAMVLTVEYGYPSLHFIDWIISYLFSDFPEYSFNFMDQEIIKIKNRYKNKIGETIDTLVLNRIESKEL